MFLLLHLHETRVLYRVGLMLIFIVANRVQVGLTLNVSGSVSFGFRFDILESESDRFDFSNECPGYLLIKNKTIYLNTNECIYVNFYTKVELILET